MLRIITGWRSRFPEDRYPRTYWHHFRAAVAVAVDSDGATLLQVNGVYLLHWFFGRVTATSPEAFDLDLPAVELAERQRKRRDGAWTALAGLPGVLQTVVVGREHFRLLAHSDAALGAFVELDPADLLGVAKAVAASSEPERHDFTLLKDLWPAPTPLLCFWLSCLSPRAYRLCDGLALRGQRVLDGRLSKLDAPLSSWEDYRAYLAFCRQVERSLGELLADPDDIYRALWALGAWSAGRLPEAALKGHAEPPPPDDGESAIEFRVVDARSGTTPLPEDLPETDEHGTKLTVLGPDPRAGMSDDDLVLALSLGTREYASEGSPFRVQVTDERCYFELPLDRQFALTRAELLALLDYFSTEPHAAKPVSLAADPAYVARNEDAEGIGAYLKKKHGLEPLFAKPLVAWLVAKDLVANGPTADTVIVNRARIVRPRAD